MHVVAVLGAAKSAYLLAQAEGVLASATDVVLLKVMNTGYLTHECLAHFCLSLVLHPLSPSFLTLQVEDAVPLDIALIGSCPPPPGRV